LLREENRETKVITFNECPDIENSCAREAISNSDLIKGSYSSRARPEIIKAMKDNGGHQKNTLPNLVIPFDL
jgi:hypothetical protein